MSKICVSVMPTLTVTLLVTLSTGRTSRSQFLMRQLSRADSGCLGSSEQTKSDCLMLSSLSCMRPPPPILTEVAAVGGSRSRVGAEEEEAELDLQPTQLGSWSEVAGMNKIMIQQVKQLIINSIRMALDNNQLQMSGLTNSTIGIVREQRSYTQY